MTFCGMRSCVGLVSEICDRIIIVTWGILGYTGKKVGANILVTFIGTENVLDMRYDAGCGIVLREKTKYAPSLLCGLFTFGRTLRFPADKQEEPHVSNCKTQK